MALTITMKQHDLLPIQTITLMEPDPTDPTGETLRAVDLTSATSAKLNATVMGGGDSFTATLTFGTRASGQVIWTPVTGDTDTDGVYDAEVEVTTSSKPETYPNDGYFTIHIFPDLG